MNQNQKSNQKSNNKSNSYNLKKKINEILNNKWMKIKNQIINKSNKNYYLKKK